MGAVIRIMNRDEFLKISFEDIIRALNIEALIHITPRSKLKKDNYVYCKFMGSEEMVAIYRGQYDPEVAYDNSDVGLYFPELKLDEYYFLENQRNWVATKIKMDMAFGGRKIISLERNLLWAILCVLHEYGHWIHFQQSGLSPKEYSEGEKEERQPHEEIVQKIYEMPDWHPYKVQWVEEYNRDIYFQYTSEKFAD